MLTTKDISSLLKKPVIQYMLLLLLLFIVAVYYGYFSLMMAPPSGTHIWRQADSASFAWSFWQNGLDLFHPQIMNRTYGNGYAVSEFPLLQYIAAVLYSLFGFHWGLLKGVYVFVFIAGILALFYIASHFIKDKFWAYSLSLLFFSAPTLVFYGNSPIPDVAALSFSFIGLAFYFSFKKGSNRWIMTGSILAFILSGLLKVTYLIPFIALLIAEGIDKIILINKNSKTSNNKLVLISTAALFFVIGMWWIIMDNYNKINEQAYFLSSINPYWNADVDVNTKGYIFKRTYTEWAIRFFHSSVHILFFLSFLFSLLFWKKVNKYIFSLTILLLLGSVLYYILWYIQFLVHDYYTILFYALYFFSLLNCCVIITSFSWSIKISYAVKIASIVLLMLNMHHVKKDFKIRFDEASQDTIIQELSDLRLSEYIRKIGVLPTDYIIAIPDQSPQVSLNYIGNAGFTEFGLGHYDIELINRIKLRDAKYLIVLDKSAYTPLLLQMGTPDWTYKNTCIYKL